jgi:hypothetical protein
MKTQSQKLAATGLLPKMIAPHKCNRTKSKTQDGRHLRRHERRWIVERLLAWIQWQRRLLIRWEYYVQFSALSNLPASCIVIPLKRV